MRSPPGLVFAVLLTTAACSDPPTAAAPGTDERRLETAAAAAVGRQIFFDPSLSLNRNQSCASCHDPAWGFTAPDPAINAGGSVMAGSVSSRSGTRRPPSASYAAFAPVRYWDGGAESFVGGNFWDGRATGARLGSPAAEQALFPFVNPVEMALPDQACVVHRVARAAYVQAYIAAWGDDIQRIAFPANTDELCGQEGVRVPLTADDRNLVAREYDRIGHSLAAFERSPAVSPFSSKYDRSLQGEASLTLLEREGYAVFVGKGRCATCHPSAGRRALFTDFTSANIGVPVNAANPELGRNAAFVDSGIGTVDTRASQSGRFKVPTLRNLSRTGIPGAARSYMHNGVFKSLEQVVHFLNTRDVLPRCDQLAEPELGVNCWPAPEVTANLNRTEVGDLGLTRHEEIALVAFLRTLDDASAAP
ncbi:MAG TPA: cytochrome c peroxidase [Gemmatimonadales bacterium]|nr:cytochrome c peroxidase [Gemmatimonadales bacterium]